MARVEVFWPSIDIYLQPSGRGWGWGGLSARAVAELAWIAGRRRHRRGADAATVQVYEATLTQHRKDDLERELPLLVVAQGIQILLAGELDHGRRAAHDD